ncbi:15399_t:CDS:2, partial [Cetraspora pellucida]
AERGIYSIGIVLDTLMCIVAAFGLFVIFVAIYFAMVINAYAERRQAKEEGVYVSSTVLEIAGSKPE